MFQGRGPAPHHPRDARLLSARHWGPHSGHPSVDSTQNKNPDLAGHMRPAKFYLTYLIVMDFITIYYFNKGFNTISEFL